MTRKIYCNECGLFLFETDKESNGAAGAEAQSKGFVFKMPILFSNSYSTLFFCDHTCGKSFYNKNIPGNEEATQKLKELKKDIPRMTKEVCYGLQKLSDELNFKLPK